MAKRFLPVSPGEILYEEFMKPLGVSINALAREINVPPNRISDIVNGKRAISADTALRLGKYFRVSPEIWMGLHSEGSVKFPIPITLSNPCNATLAPLTASALVDTAALHLCIPEHLAIQLKLERLEERELATADGIKRLCAYVGPVEVRFGKRGCYTGALVLGDEILLGAVPMQDMDLVVSPATRSVTVNPASPNVPSSTAKQIAILG